MKVICPQTDQICFSGCHLPCKPPEINKAAVDISNAQKTEFEGIIALFLNAQKVVNVESETLDDDETEIHRLKVNIPL